MFKIKLIIKCIAPEVKTIIRPNEETCFIFSKKTLVLGQDFFQKKLSEGFLRHLARQHRCKFTYEFKSQMWILLHELGHCKTQDYIKENELSERVIYSMIKPSVLAANPRLEERYFNLSSEWEATEWAKKWIEEHKILAKIFNCII